MKIKKVCLKELSYFVFMWKLEQVSNFELFIIKTFRATYVMHFHPGEQSNLYCRPYGHRLSFFMGYGLYKVVE